jgi:hypothetical protein
MGNNTSTDNIYPEGTFLTAKALPEQKLVVTKYYQRIYYCSIVGQPDHKQLAYYEHELIPPRIA